MAATAFNPLHILKQSSRLSLSSLVGFGLMFIANLAMGRVLTPEEVGVIALAGVWSFYGGLVKSGLYSGAGRDMPHLIGSGDRDGARRLQNIAITGELIFSLVPLAVMVLAGFFYNDFVVRTALWLSAITFVVQLLQTLFGGLLVVYQRFDVLAGLRILTSIVTPVGILLTLGWLRVYGPVIMPAVAGLAALVVIVLNWSIFEYRPAWDWAVARDLVRTGLPFVLLTFVSWAYFMSDRPAILAAGVSLAMIGYYAFASNLIRAVAQVFWDFTAVLQPILWQEIGRRGSVQNTSRDLVRIWVPYTAAACGAATVGQTFFGAVVTWVAPRFGPAVPVFEVLVFLLVFYNATQLPNLVLSSKAVNRQGFNAALWSLGLVLNVIVLYVVARAGLGLVAIAVASMLIDLVIGTIGFIVIRRHLFQTWRQALPLYGWLASLMLVTVALYGLFQWEPMAYLAANNVWTPLILRILAGAVIWGTVAAIMSVWLRTWAAPAKTKTYFKSAE